jgi:hypothetical protein
LVFLAMLLWEGGETPEVDFKRCPVNPLSKKRCCRTNDALRRCAGYSVILSYWKLRDSARDETFFKRLAADAAKFFLRRAYKRAARRYPRFDGEARAALDELARLEASADGGASIDAAADKFARILRAAADHVSDAARRRALEQLLYHTGRWIYIVDACDDLAEDVARGRFNPVAARLRPAEGGALGAEPAELMRATLTHSANLAGSAFELLDETAWAPIVRNILCLGMSSVCSSVLSGERRRRARRRGKNFGAAW